MSVGLSQLRVALGSSVLSLVSAWGLFQSFARGEESSFHLGVVWIYYSGMLAPECPPHAPCHHWGSSSSCSEFEHLSLWTLGICQLTIPWLFYLFEEFFSVHASHILCMELKGIPYIKKYLILPSPDFHPFHLPRSPASVPSSHPGSSPHTQPGQTPLFPECLNPQPLVVQCLQGALW